MTLRFLIAIVILLTSQLSAALKKTETIELELPGTPGIVKRFGGSSMKEGGQK